MNDQALIVYVIQLLVQASVAAVAFLVWSLVQKYNLQSSISLLVYAAEQMFNTPGMGQMKKQWVIDQLSTKFNIDIEELEIYIEAAVAELKKYRFKLITPPTPPAPLK